MKWLLYIYSFKNAYKWLSDRIGLESLELILAASTLEFLFLFFSCEFIHSLSAASIIGSN